MMKYTFSLLASLFLLGCSQSQSVPEPTEAAQPDVSRFDGLELTLGINREMVEEQVSELLGRPSTYSPWGNNLRGGTVQYRDGDWVLEVTYKSGAPAPTIITPDGKAQGYPPIDETVIEYKTTRIPNQELKATGEPAP